MDGLILLRQTERLVLSGCVPLLIWIGYRLFVMGVTGQIKLSVNAVGIKSALTNASPGIVCFLLAAILGLASYSNPVSFEEGNDDEGGSFSGYSGGAKTGRLLSEAIGEALIEFGSNVAQDGADVQKYMSDLIKKIKMVPTLADIQQIRTVEDRAQKGSLGAQEQLKSLNEQYLGGISP